MVAGFAHASCALAQIYKCTDADGRTAFSDKPCATPPGAAGSATRADAISAMCAKNEGSKATDELIKSLPEKQRETVIAALRGVIAGMARDPAAQETLRRVTLTIDASRTAVICVPIRRTQPPGAPPAFTYTAYRIEPNGRGERLQPGTQPLVFNDANQPTTMAARCASLVTSCVRSKPRPGRSIDECFDKAPVCPGGRLDPALRCCPQACKDAYNRERSRGTDAETATTKVIFGDDAGAASCVPGMPKRG